MASSPTISTLDFSDVIASTLETTEVTGQLLTTLSIVNYICTVIENASLKLKLSSDGKLSLALSQSSTIVDHLNRKGLIDAELYKTMEVLMADSDQMTLLITDIVLMWNSSIPEVVSGCCSPRLGKSSAAKKSNMEKKKSSTTKKEKASKIPSSPRIGK